MTSHDPRNTERITVLMPGVPVSEQEEYGVRDRVAQAAMHAVDVGVQELVECVGPTIRALLRIVHEAHGASGEEWTLQRFKVRFGVSAEGTLCVVGAGVEAAIELEFSR